VNAIIATSRFDSRWGWYLFEIGLMACALGLFSRFVLQRDKTKEERDEENSSMFGARAYLIGWLGVPVVAIGLILLVLSIA
jgi:hypothetical protein